MIMKIKCAIFILLMLVLAFTSIFAQEADTIKVVNVDSLVNSGQICFDPVPEDSITKEDEIFVMPVMPKFPGGNVALKKFISENLRWPIEFDGMGTVFLRFEVKKTGEIGKVEIQRGVDPLLDKEAIRVIKTLPKFKPGMQDGKPVNVWYSVTVPFKLN